jgi:hypothetical protein
MKEFPFFTICILHETEPSADVVVANSTEETNKDNRFMSQQNRFMV